MWDSFIRLKNSLAIIKLSLSYMWAHARLWAFPVLITACLAPFFISIFLYGVNHAPEFPIFRLIFLLLVAYFVSSFIATFFGVAVAHVTLKLFEHKQESLGESLMLACSHLRLITEWSVLFSFMHFNLSALTKEEHEHDGTNSNPEISSRRKHVSRAVSSIAEFAWELTVFLVLPIIAFESVPLAGLLNHAMQRMKDCFGEIIIAQFSFYTVNLLAGIVSAALILFSTVYGNFYITSLLIIVSVFIGATLFIAQTIFKTAVYAYGHNKPTGIFTIATIEHYFGKSKK